MAYENLPNFCVWCGRVGNLLSQCDSPSVSSVPRDKSEVLTSVMQNLASPRLPHSRAASTMVMVSSAIILRRLGRRWRIARQRLVRGFVSNVATCGVVESSLRSARMDKALLPEVVRVLVQ